jgi:transposase InsO family protein
VAEAVGISRKNIYYIPQQPCKDALMAQKIRDVHKQHPAYGQRRVALHLGINYKRASRVMTLFGISPPRRHKKHYCTRAKPHHQYTNLIKDLDLRLVHPNHVWVSDISYLKYQKVFWYIATIKDVATRKILALEVGRQHNARLIQQTIDTAVQRTNRYPTIMHMDQGKENLAVSVTSKLEKAGVQISVSDKASPWQNGYMESFFGRFKEEFGDVDRFETPAQLIEAIYSYVHYYNFERIHTSLKMSPATYTQLYFSEYCLEELGA